jgi:2-phosphoglycolate phosphatase
MGRIRAVLFDFDGTLADAYAGIATSVNHVRATHGLAPLTEPEVRKHVGHGPLHLLEHTVPGGDPERDVACYRAHHPSVMKSGTRLLPGALETLTTLKQHGLRVAICSNKPSVFTRELLDYLKIAPLVDVVLGPDDVPQPKPAPDMLLAALERLHVSAAEAIYVGDMAIDVQVARAAGIAVCVVPTGSDDRATLEAARPERLLGGLLELPEVVSGEWCGPPEVVSGEW